MRFSSHPIMYATAVILSLSLLQVAAQTCKAACNVRVNNGEQLRWMPNEFSTTIVAATVVEIVNTDLHTTKLSTIYNEIPAGYTVPKNTNAQGTQTVQVTYVRTGKTLTTDIAFPTEFNKFPSNYYWSGTLPTKDSAGNTVCSTAINTATVKVVSDYWSQASTFTTPTHKYGPDPGGLLFTTWYGPIMQMAITYKSAFPSEGALQTCVPDVLVAPANADLTARFITETSVSYEGSGSSSSASVADKPASSSNSALTASSKAVQDSTSEEKSSQTSTQTPTTQKFTSTSFNTIVSDSPSGPVTLTNTVQVISIMVSTPGQASQSASKTLAAQTITSTSLNTIVTDSPSGPVTLVSTVQIISVMVSSPEGTSNTATDALNNARTSTNAALRLGSNFTFWMWLASLLTLAL